MKKLIIVLAAVVVSAAVQAATVNWGGDSVSSLPGVDYPGYSNENSWYGVYMLSDTADSLEKAFFADTKVFAPKNGSDAVTATLLDQHTLDYDEWDNGAFTSSFTGDASDLNGKTYAIVLYDGTADNAQYSVALYTVSGLDDAGGAKEILMDGSGDGSLLSANPTGTTFYGVAPAPEPTGGLLMLVGFAALALRRRRA